MPKAWLANSGFWWALGIAALIAASIIARKRIKDPDEFSQMKWMDWCGTFALTGIVMVLVFGLLGLDVLRSAGMLLVYSLYPVAVLGLIGRFDQFFSEIIRAIRRR